MVSVAKPKLINAKSSLQINRRRYLWIDPEKCENFSSNVVLTFSPYNDDDEYVINWLKYYTGLVEKKYYKNY